MSGANAAAATGLAADLALSDADFDAKYGDVRRVLTAAYERRRLTRLADRGFAHLENLLLGSRVRRPLERPAFVTGSYRSGTTMLERILARHPALATFDHLGYSFPTSPLVSHALRRMLARADAPFAAPDQPNLEHRSSSPAEVEPIWQHCRRNLWSDVRSHVLASDYTDARFERVFVATANKVLLRARRPRFLNKNPVCTLRVGYLARVFPNARFVHLVRHPHRVVRSQLDLEAMWARVLRPRSTLGDAVERDWARTFVDAFMPPERRFPRTENWTEIERVRDAHPALAVALSVVDFESALDRALASAHALAERVLRVRYEDVLADPARVLRAIFAHLELDDEDAGAIADDAARTFVDRALASHTSPLPRFEARAEDALARLVERGRYHVPPKS